MRLLVTTHIADGIKGIDGPKQRGHTSKHHPQWFRGKAQGDLRQNINEINAGALSRKHGGEQRQHHEQQ